MTVTGVIQKNPLLSHTLSQQASLKLCAAGGQVASNARHWTRRLGPRTGVPEARRIRHQVTSVATKSHEKKVRPGYGSK